MLSHKLLKIIDGSFIGRVVSRKKEIIEGTNPDKIYIENVRSFFNISFRFATVLCEKAVEYGYFDRFYGYKCPINDNIIYSSKTLISDSREFICGTCEDLGEENYRHRSDELKVVIYYRLVKQSSSYAAG